MYFSPTSRKRKSTTAFHKFSISSASRANIDNNDDDAPGDDGDAPGGDEKCEDSSDAPGGDEKCEDSSELEELRI